MKKSKTSVGYGRTLAFLTNALNVIFFGLRPTESYGGDEVMVVGVKKGVKNEI